MEDYIGNSASEKRGGENGATDEEREREGALTYFEKRILSRHLYGGGAEKRRRGNEKKNVMIKGASPADSNQAVLLPQSACAFLLPACLCM